MIKDIPKIYPMITNGLNIAKNQYIIDTDKYIIFQSYETKIALKEKKTQKIYLDVEYWNCSKTTSKYRNEFLQLTTKETQERIDNRTIKLRDLNK